MWDDIKRLHDHHSDAAIETRLLKLTEEVGEVAEAVIGLPAPNTRKGGCRTQDDLFAELCDVIIPASAELSGTTEGAVG